MEGNDSRDEEENDHGGGIQITGAQLDAGENGTAVVVESGRADLVDSQLSGRTGIRNNDVVGLRNSTVEADDTGYIGNPDSVGVFDNSRIEGGDTDILTFPGAQVAIYNTAAADIVRLTRESRDILDPAKIDTGDGHWLLDDPGLYHISCAILSANDLETKREYGGELLTGVFNNWDRLFEGFENLEELQRKITLLIHVYWLARILVT